MVTNPNSNLVFDFPDPTPRFEFDDSPTRNNNKPNNNNNTPPSRKTGKRFGKFSTKKLITGRGGNSSGGGDKDDGLDETNDTAATSLNSSLNSSTTANSPPSLKRNNSGDKAAGLNFTLADSSSSNINNNNSSSSSSSTKLNLLPSIGSTTLHKRNPSIASGYVSEVSEFSFDRVTVTTNDTDGIMTGQSSNVSWNFMDETVLGAGGLQLQSGGGGGVEGTKYNNSTSVGCVPYTGGGGSLVNGKDGGGGGNNRNGSPNGSRLMDTPTRETGVALTMNMASSQAALTNNNNSQQQTKKRNVYGGGGGRGRTQSSSTFDNVSLDTEDELDNIPFNGMVQRSDNSVISEISERSRRTTATQSQVGEGAVKALLREGMVNVNLRENGMLLDPALPNESKSTLRRRSSHHNQQQQQQQMNINNNKNDGAKSTTSSKTSNYNNLLEDITSNYAKFKTSRNNGQKEGRSILSSIIEDVQFCGLYFCGIDTTVTEDDEEAAMMQKNNKGGGVSSYEETLKKKKEGRKKETEDTFLGKVISCVPKTMCGVDYEEHTTAFCGGGR